MDTFEKRCDEYIGSCYSFLSAQKKQDLKRLFYAGALELLDLLGTTSDDPVEGEKQTVAISQEIYDWCGKEATVIMKQVNRLKKEN